MLRIHFPATGVIRPTSSNFTVYNITSLVDCTAGTVDTDMLYQLPYSFR